VIANTASFTPMHYARPFYYKMIILIKLNGNKI